MLEAAVNDGTEKLGLQKEVLEGGSVNTHVVALLDLLSPIGGDLSLRCCAMR